MIGYFPPPHLGGTFDDISSVLAKIPQYTDIVLSVLEDPALPVIINDVRILDAMPSSSAKPNQPKRKGVGLDVAVKPLEYYIWTRRHPTQTKFVVAGIVALPVLLGFLLGSRFGKGAHPAP